MTGTIADALHQLQRHRGLVRVGEPRKSGESTQIEVDVAVELPSRSRRNGVSGTGVRSVETCVLVFGSDWPMSAPKPFLRADFPLNLPHINPHREGEPVSPCLFEGAMKRDPSECDTGSAGLPAGRPAAPPPRLSQTHRDRRCATGCGWRPVPPALAAGGASPPETR